MSSDNVCLICHDESGELTNLPCNHKYHAGCIYMWLTRSKCCPLRCVPDVTDDLKSALQSKFTLSDHWNHMEYLQKFVVNDDKYVIKDLKHMEYVTPRIRSKFVKLSPRIIETRIPGSLIPSSNFTGNKAEMMVCDPRTKVLSNLHFTVKGAQFFTNKKSTLSYFKPTRDEDSMQVILKKDFVEMLTSMAKVFGEKAKTLSTLKILGKRPSTPLFEDDSRPELPPKDPSICLYIDSNAKVLIRQENEDGQWSPTKLSDSSSIPQSSSGFGDFVVTLGIYEYDFGGVKKCFTNMNCSYCMLNLYTPVVDFETLLEGSTAVSE